ncbi:hypothetical protein PMAYCL1PPCAC_00383, partial [Pristionchus mayeri]
SVDFRFPALCLIVKEWASNQMINRPLDGTFNNYSFNLMVLHYLQCGVVPAILPNLQVGQCFRFLSSNNSQYFSTFIRICSDYNSGGILNEQSVGEILIGFFQYFSKFEFEKYAISIKKGSVFPRCVI